MAVSADREPDVGLVVCGLSGSVGGWLRMYACLYASVPPGTRCVADDAKALWRPSVVIGALRESPSAWVPSVATLFLSVPAPLTGCRLLLRVVRRWQGSPGRGP